jgi:hypothetical protein
MPRQPERVCSKGIGFNNLRTSLQILMVYRPNQVGLGEIQLVVAAVNKDAFCVKQCSHRAIAENWTPLKPGKNIFGHNGEDTRSTKIPASNKEYLEELSNARVVEVFAAGLCYNPLFRT